MASTYPRVELSWQYDTGRDLGGVSTGTYGAFLLALVNSFLGFSLNPWVVKGSSNSVTAGMDNVNRWVSASNLVWSSSGARSWIVLENVSGLQILIHLAHNSQYAMLLALSKNGFTGGSISAAPTATDQVFWGDDTGCAGNPFTWDNDLGGSSNHLYMLHSNDGKHTRVFFTGSGSSVPNYGGAWIIGELAEAPAALTKPYYAFLDWMWTPTSSGMTWQALTVAMACFLPSGPSHATYVTENSPAVGDIGGGAGSYGLGPEMGIANQISTEWPMQPLYLFEPTVKAFLGRPVDLWLGASENTSGTLLPASGTKQFAQFGPFFVPWLNSLPAPVVP